MSISINEMKVLDRKLKSGLKYRNVKLDPYAVTAWPNAYSKTAYLGARSSGQMEGFGEDNLVNQLQTGEMFPDQIMGWSTKSILVGLLLLSLLKMRGR